MLDLAEGRIYFQRSIIGLQRCWVETASNLAESTLGPSIVFADRTACDGQLFMNNEEWEEVMRREETTSEELIGVYDAVFILESSAGK